MAKEEKNQSAETKAVEKKKENKPSGGNKFIKAITGIPKRMWNAIQNTIAELKKVTWPTLKDLRSYTAIVLAFMVVMAIIIGVFDLGASQLVSLIIRR